MNLKVSVSVITYNHEQFVAQAIESVLMQKVNFDYELIIGEDHSSDRTREIVKKYKERYPDKIRLFLNDRSNVIYIDGRPTGRWNFVNNLRHAQGQYVALLEGDDYWTSPDKLQSQVDFLDAKPSCAICFHAVRHHYEDGNQRVRFSGVPLLKEIYTIEDLLERNFIAACSVMFRNGLIGEFPDWYYRMPMGDWPLHILNAQYGDIGYINRVMGVHRVHRGGVWSSVDTARVLEYHITFLKEIMQHLSGQYSQMLQESIARRYLPLVRSLVCAKDYSSARRYVSELLSHQHTPKRSLAKAIIWRLIRDMRAVKRKMR